MYFTNTIHTNRKMIWQHNVTIVKRRYRKRVKYSHFFLGRKTYDGRKIKKIIRRRRRRTELPYLNKANNTCDYWHDNAEYFFRCVVPPPPMKEKKEKKKNFKHNTNRSICMGKCLDGKIFSMCNSLYEYDVCIIATYVMMCVCFFFLSSFHRRWENVSIYFFVFFVFLFDWEFI